MIGIFSPLPSNVIKRQIKINNQFIDLPQELTVSRQRNTQRSITSALSLHELDVFKSTRMAL